MNRKGDSTKARPHRRAVLLHAPSPMEAVSRELLAALAATRAAAATPTAKGNGETTGDFDLDRWIAEHEIEVLREGPWSGGRRWLLRACPFNADHVGGSAAILQHASGAAVFRCQHDGCAGRDWRDLRQHFEPNACGGSQHDRQYDRRDQERVTTEDSGPRPVLTPVHSIARREVEWLWDDRIPRGKITILDGDPGLGKSTVTLDVAARISTGRPMPDGTPGVSGSVLLCSYEDDAGDTIRPRLEAAGADLTRIHILTVDSGDECDRLVELPGDLSLLEDAIVQRNVVLVVIDPLMAALSGSVDSHRDQDVRRVLSPLSKIAERTGAAVVLVRHLNKGGGNGTSATYRGGGSIGIIGAARSGLLVARDPEDPDRRVLAPVKSNNAAPAAALGFRTIATDLGVAIEWLGTSSCSADELLAMPTGREERSACDEAMAFLRDYLDASPRPASDVWKASKAQRIAEPTLKRAKSALGIKATKQGFGKGSEWVWSLPPICEGDRTSRRGSTSLPLETWSPSEALIPFAGSDAMAEEKLDEERESWVL